MTKLLMLDICCGLKGASQAMKDRGWDVVTLDNDPKFEPDICIDVRKWDIWGHPDLIWCSPPCTEFSRESMPWFRTGIAPDMSIFHACMDIIHEAKPRYWVIENTKGAISYFYPFIGKWKFHSAAYYLWGSFPDISGVRLESRKEHMSSAREAERAKIPYALSLALAKAIEVQA